MVSFTERRVRKPSQEELIAGRLLDYFAKKFPDKEIPWQEFADISQVSLESGPFNFNINSSPREIQEFLTKFTQARMAGEEEFEKFLKEQEKYGDDFFEKRVGPEGADESSLTVSQVNRIIVYLLNSGYCLRSTAKMADILAFFRSKLQ